MTIAFIGTPINLGMPIFTHNALSKKAYKRDLPELCSKMPSWRVNRPKDEPIYQKITEVIHPWHDDRQHMPYFKIIILSTHKILIIPTSKKKFLSIKNRWWCIITTDCYINIEVIWIGNLYDCLGGGEWKGGNLLEPSADFRELRFSEDFLLFNAPFALYVSFKDDVILLYCLRMSFHEASKQNEYLNKSAICSENSYCLYMKIRS